LTRGTVTNNSVHVTGNLSNPGGANITLRGFWIRRDDQVTPREITVSTTSNTFSTTITGLTPNSVYRVRAISRATGFTGTQQSSENVFTTQQQGATVPDAPRNLTVTPSTNQVRLNWQAPANNGGAAITRYEVSLNNGTWVTASSTTQHTFTINTTGTQTVRVRAVNSAGAGALASATSVQFFRVTFDPSPINPTGAFIGDDDVYDADDYQLDYSYEVYESSYEGLSYEDLNHQPLASEADQYIDIAPLMAGPLTIHVPANTALGTNNIPHPGGTNFSGWFTTAGVQITANTTPTANITAFAQRSNITITFNAQGGSAVPPRTLPPVSRIGTLPTTIRSGHRFDGWFRSPSGAGSRIGEDEVFAISTTLHARWTQIPQPTIVRVTFDANGGRLTNPDDWSREVTTGSQVHNFPAVTRSGFTFVSWNTRADGTGDSMPSGSSFVRNTTLFAI